MKEKLYELSVRFLKRFPSGRHAAMIKGELNKDEPDFEEVLWSMKEVADQKDSDRRYRSEKDIEDAKKIVSEMNKLAVSRN